MIGVVVIGLAVVALLLALFGVGLVMGPARSDRWAARVFGPRPAQEHEPVTGYSDPGVWPRSREFGG